MNYAKLPKGYKKIGIIDLDSKKSPEKRSVSMIAMALAVIVALLGYLRQPFGDAASSLLGKTWVLIALMGVLFVYILLHEVMHGIFIRALSKTKPVYGMKSIYLYAGSSAYLDRRSHAVIALAPALIFGVIFV